MQIFGSNELLEDVQNRELCVGCGACVNLCPYFKNHNGKTVMLFPCTLEQGRCYAYCPKAEVDYSDLAMKVRGEPYDESPIGNFLEIRIAKAGPKMKKANFQAGGTASSLIAFALDSGEIDGAVLTDSEGIVPKPRVVKDSDEVLQCASSKYSTAPVLAAYNQGIKDGLTRMGIVGMPCQMLALAQMKANPLQREDFLDAAALTIGLFCTWGLDRNKLFPYLAERVDISKIKGMDVPPPPSAVLEVDLGDEKYEISLDEIRPLVPETCFICPDMTSEWADVSVGVLEGDASWNSLIIRTERGKEIVNKAVEAGYLELGELPSENLDHLKEASGNKKMRGLSKAMEDGLFNTDEEGKHSAMRIDPEVADKIMS